MDDRVEQTLRRVDLFSRLDDELLEVVAVSSRLEPFDVGDRLVAQGAAADGVWVVVEGTLEGLRHGERKVSLGPGALVGDLSTLSGEPHALEIIATSRGERLVLGIDEFRASVRHRPEVAWEMIRVLIDRIYHMQAAADRAIDVPRDHAPPMERRTDR